MDPITALTLATVIYAIVLILTYIFFIHKSPEGYKKPKLVEIVAIAILIFIFFGLGYFLIALFK
ncbi:MAG: hypothetical protein QXK71_04895 [Pyrobaculum sp.]|jgi:hypothetical protein